MNEADVPRDGEIDIAGSLAILRRGWRLIVLLPLIALFIGVIYLNVTPARYAVKMRVTPVVTAGGDGLSGKLSQFGGLAAVAGVSLPESGGQGSFKLYVEALHSRDVAELLAQDRDIMRGVFYREWDARTRQWVAPSGFVVTAAKTAKSLIGLPNQPWDQPRAARLQAWMAEQIAVEQNVKSPAVTITLQATDPKFAVTFLNRLNSTIDGMLKERAMLRTNDYIRYLSQRLSTVDLAEQRVAIAQALGEQERIKMAASADRPFAAELFEHPAASDRPVTPKPVRVLGIALALGLIAGLGWAFLFTSRRRPRGAIAA